MYDTLILQILTSAHYEDRLHSLICFKNTVWFSSKSKVCNGKLYTDKSFAVAKCTEVIHFQWELVIWDDTSDTDLTKVKRVSFFAKEQWCDETTSDGSKQLNTATNEHIFRKKELSMDDV